ncbi:MAG: hypothetical protein ABTS16_00845 [Candidatus Accumulibacter phosphatis]|jgi:hypothetical protein|nr:hypothetical protein [Candidatus Accumulibacter contiguus]
MQEEAKEAAASVRGEIDAALERIAAVICDTGDGRDYEKWRQTSFLRG